MLLKLRKYLAFFIIGVSIFFLVITLIYAIFLSRITHEYGRSISPDGQYYLVAKSYTLRNFRFFAAPGDGGGHYDNGVIELYTINGKSLGSKYTQTMELINQTAWDKDEVYVKLVGYWKLPVPLSQQLIDEKVKLDGINFDDASDELKDNKEITFKAIQRFGGHLCSASSRLQDDRELVIAAIEKYGGNITCASKRLHDDEQIILTSIVNGYNFSGWNHASDRVKKVLEPYLKSKDFIMSFLRMQPYSSQHTSITLTEFYPELKNDKDFVSIACEYSKRGCEVIMSDNLLDNKNIVLQAVQEDGYILEHASKKLRDDLEVALTAISQSGSYVFSYASSELKDNKDFILASMIINNSSNHCVNILEHSSPRFRHNAKLIKQMDMICRQEYEFKFASQEIRDNKTIALAAIIDDSKNLQYVSPTLRDDIDLASAAIRNDSSAIKSVSLRLQFDKTLLLLAAEGNNSTLCLNQSIPSIYDNDIPFKDEINKRCTKNELYNLVSAKGRDNKMMMQKVVARRGYDLKHVSERLQDDYDVVLNAILNEPYAIKYASDRLQNNKDLLLAGIDREYPSKACFRFRNFISENVNLYNDQGFINEFESLCKE